MELVVAHSIAKVICPGSKRNDGYLEGGGLCCDLVCRSSCRTCKPSGI